MNVEKRAKIIIEWINDYCEKTSFNPKSLIVGISGGIDSSVVSTLCALTGIERQSCLACLLNKLKLTA